MKGIGSLRIDPHYNSAKYLRAWPHPDSTEQRGSLGRDTGHERFFAATGQGSEQPELSNSLKSLHSTHAAVEILTQLTASSQLSLPHVDPTRASLHCGLGLAGGRSSWHCPEQFESQVLVLPRSPCHLSVPPGVTVPFHQPTGRHRWHCSSLQAASAQSQRQDAEPQTRSLRNTHLL